MPAMRLHRAIACEIRLLRAHIFSGRSGRRQSGHEADGLQPGAEGRRPGPAARGGIGQRSRQGRRRHGVGLVSRAAGASPEGLPPLEHLGLALRLGVWVGHLQQEGGDPQAAAAAEEEGRDDPRHAGADHRSPPVVGGAGGAVGAPAGPARVRRQGPAGLGKGDPAAEEGDRGSVCGRRGLAGEGRGIPELAGERRQRARERARERVRGGRRAGGGGELRGEGVAEDRDAEEGGGGAEGGDRREGVPAPELQGAEGGALHEGERVAAQALLSRAQHSVRFHSSLPLLLSQDHR